MARDYIRVENGKHDLCVSETVSKSAMKETTELQKIRREMLSLSDRAKKLADRIQVLITEQGKDIA